jgi:hypothetical protein
MEPLRSCIIFLNICFYNIMLKKYNARFIRIII